MERNVRSTSVGLWRSTLRCLVGLIVVGALSGCGALRKLSDIIPPDPELTVLSYNIHHGEGTDGVWDLQRIADLILEHAPDVVALQEVDVGTFRSSRVDQARRLADLTGMDVVFGEFMEYDGGLYGMAILSKHRFLESYNHRLPRGPEPRTSLTAKIRLPNGASVWVSNVHLYRTEQERFGQVQRLLRVLANETDPIILVGDFNSRRGDLVMERVEEEFSVPMKFGPTNTFPSDMPNREIDFVAFRPRERFTLLDYRVIDERVASDHRPVLARFRIGGE